MKPIYAFRRWVFEIFWLGTNNMYLDVRKGEVLAPNGDLYARYDPDSQKFRFMLNGEMRDSLPETMQELLSPIYSRGYQLLCNNQLN